MFSVGLAPAESRLANEKPLLLSGGGWLRAQLGFGGFTGFDVRGLVTGTAGALVLLIGYRLISRRK